MELQFYVWIVFFFLQLIQIKHIQSQRLVRREFGDIGDEVSTNLPVRKSIIPYELSNPPADTTSSADKINKLLNKKAILRQTYPQPNNPNSENKLLKTVSIQKRTQNNLNPINEKQLHALKYLKAIVDPFSDIQIYKKKLIGQTRSSNEALTQHFPSRKSYYKNHSKLLFNPIMKRAFYKKQSARSYINSRKPGFLPYGFHKKPSKRQFTSKFLQNKGNILNTWRYNLYRRNPLQEIDKRRKYHEYHKSSTDNKVNITKDLINQSNKHNESSLLKDLSHVTMKWTGVKDSATVNTSTIPTWFSTLKKVIQPKVSSVSSKNLMSAPLEKQRLNAAVPAEKEKLTAVMNSIYPSPKFLSKSQQLKTSANMQDASKPQVIDASTETNIQSDDNETPDNHENITNVETANKKQLQVYQSFSISNAPTPTSYYQQPLPTSWYPPVTTTTQGQTFNYYNQQQQQQQQGLNLVPWNYYHSEYLPDGRIRTALYPIAKHIPYGRCLPENSLCDHGHDEQCCGPSTFCVNYWGLNKCLAYNQISNNQLYNPYQIYNDKNYKNYYNYFVSKAKAGGPFMK